jgi:hypothetical protein
MVSVTDPYGHILGFLDRLHVVVISIFLLLLCRILVIDLTMLLVPVALEFASINRQ